MVTKAPTQFYNFNKVCSYNATYMFVVGQRGLGKTYGAKKKAIRDGINKGDQFIYLRRYKTELVTSRNTFFADVKNEFPNVDFRTNGNLAQYAPIESRDEKKREWTTIGYFIALSTSQNQKSVAFPNVKTIIFDEFIIEKGTMRYLPSESTVFNNFFSTVDRYKDKTKVFFLANSVSIMNPYFIDYEIRPDEESEFVTKAEGFIVAHFPNAEGFTAEVFQTKFGKFIQGTEYAEYAVANEFSDNHNAMLGLKDSKARYMFSLETKRGTFSVWVDLIANEYYIQSKPVGDPILLTLLPERMDNNKTLVTLSDRTIANLRTAFRQANVSFDKPTTRNTFAEIFK